MATPPNVSVGMSSYISPICPNQATRKKNSGWCGFVHLMLGSIVFFSLKSDGAFAERPNEAVKANPGVHNNDPHPHTMTDKIKSLFGRKLFDSGEHAKAGEDVILPGFDDTTRGTDLIFFSEAGTHFSFGNLTYLAGDFLGPHEDRWVICNADDYEASKEAARRMAALFDDPNLAGEERIKRASDGMTMERAAAAEQTEIFQKHVAVHKVSYSEFNKVDDIGNLDYANCGIFGSEQNSACMLAINLDHFGECAKRTYQIFHDLALEEAASEHTISALKTAYFYEGVGSHALTDLFSAGHVRTPSKRLRGDHCSAYTGGFATNQMHDEDSYNGLFMTNRNQSEPWWVFGDSFYFEPFAKKNKEMIHTALQESINEVHEAFEAGGSATQAKGHSDGNIVTHPGRGLDFVPDLEISEEKVPEFWDVNTCPLWIERGSKMYRRFPWYRLRSEKGRKMEDQQPASNKFGLFASTFPLVDDDKQLQIHGQPDLKLGDCWFKEAPMTMIWSDECTVFGKWEADEMFYSREVAGFMPPTFATCQLYSKEKEFDNDCYDVLELVSKGQECDDLKVKESCQMLQPRCTWRDNSWVPDIISETGSCVQGSCVAFSNEAGETVKGDPTPSVPVAPKDFYMSFQGACAFNALDPSSFKKMPGSNSAKKCAELCIDYTGHEGQCTGIAVDSGAFGDCYLYFNNACQRADSPGLARCPSHGLQTFHRGSKSMKDIMDKCACSDDWYYKDPNTRYSGCQSVEEKSWGSWCFLANPDECEIGMHSTTQSDEKWRYCDEATCEHFSCPNEFVRRDSVICYDESCDVGDCCVVDPTLECTDMNSKSNCENIDCKWIDGWFRDSCEEDSICEISRTAEECQNKGCAWQDGYLWDSCEEGTCDNWYNKGECEHWGCKWNSAWYYSDYCSHSLSFEVEMSRNLGMLEWEGAVDSVLADTDIISTLAMSLIGTSSPMSDNLQAKLEAMLVALEHFDDEGIFFASFDDGRYYSLKYCLHGPSCWSKYPGAEYTFGVVEPGWSEYMNIFKVVSGKIDMTENHISEFNVPDFAHEAYIAKDQEWYGQSGWTAPFTCTLMHPDESEICEVYSVGGEDFTLGVQMLSIHKGN